MKHKWIKQEEVTICEECGYVWGEIPYQKCPMSLDKRILYTNCSEWDDKLEIDEPVEEEQIEDILNPSCSEEVFKLILGEWLLDKEKEKFIEKTLEQFQPWSDDKKECDEFALLDEYNNCILIRDRDDGGEETEELDKECKKLKIKMKCIGGKEDRPLFSEGTNFYYKLEDNVKVVNLDYSNVPKANEIHKKLLKIWKRR